MKMKKIISTCLASAMIISSASILNVSATNHQNNDSEVVQSQNLDANKKAKVIKILRWTGIALGATVATTFLVFCGYKLSQSRIQKALKAFKGLVTKESMSEVKEAATENQTTLKNELEKIQLDYKKAKDAKAPEKDLEELNKKVADAQKKLNNATKEVKTLEKNSKILEKLLNN